MSSSTNDPCEAFFPADPDVAGIGIRISTYITTILLALVWSTVHASGTYPGIACFIVSTAGLQGMVLLITAIIQTAQEQLSLYHAFIIFHLLSFLGVNLGPSLVRRDLDKLKEDSVAMRLVLSSVLSTMAGLAYFGWMIYLLSHAKTFGPPELQQCNDRVLYVFFFKSVHATSKWVRIVLALFGILPLGFAVPLIGPIFHAVYGVVTLELMIQRNKFIIKEGETGWGFGQVLAMILLIEPFREILDAAVIVWEHARDLSEISSPGLLRSSAKCVSLIRKLVSPKKLEIYSARTDNEPHELGRTVVNAA